jgi:hypothetical protein
MPIALAGMVAPHAWIPAESVHQALWGYALVAGALAEALTRAELGAGYILAVLAMTALTTALFWSAVRAHACCHGLQKVAHMQPVRCFLRVAVSTLTYAQMEMSLSNVLCIQQDGGWQGLAWLVAAAVPAAAMVAPHALNLSLHIVQKATTSGALFRQYGSDIVVAAVMGMATLGLLGSHGTILAHLSRRKIKVWTSHQWHQLCNIVGS